MVTGEEMGYRSSSGMKGTLLQTDLRNIGTSISVINAAFIQDTGSKDIEDLLLLTPNTEIGGLGGNFSATQVEFDDGGGGAGIPIPEVQRDNNRGGFSRIRGLIEADLTRDYFITDVPFDTFNTSRVAVQRGANSILFGLGSPSGIVNQSTIKADFLGNHGRITLESDQHGTQRGSLRYNVEIIDDRLSMLVAALYDKERYEQRQAFEDDKRVYASGTWKITRHIRLQVNAEAGERFSARPDYVPPNDGITPWLLAGKPIGENPQAGATLFRGRGDFFPPEANNSTNSRLLSPEAPGTSSGFVEFFHNPGNPDPSFAGSVFVRSDRGTPENSEFMLIRVRPMIRSMKLAGGWWPGGGTVVPGTARFYNTGSVDLQILDRSIFDYRKNLFSGGASTQGSNWTLIQGALEGYWWENKIGLELAAFKQDMDSWRYNMLLGAEQRSIVIDINQYLMAQDGSGSWIPNPAFGQPAMGGHYGGADLTFDRESLRATAYLDLQAEDFMKATHWTAKLLGSLRLTGVVQESTRETRESFGGRGGVDPQTTADALAGGNIFALSDETYRKGMQFTLPSKRPLNALTATSLDDFRGAHIGPVPFGRQRDRPHNPQTYTGWDSVSESFVEFTTPVYTIRDNNGFLSAFFANKQKTEIDSWVAVAQWMLWEELIVLTGSWRNDRERYGSVGAPSWEPYGDGRALARHDDTLSPIYRAGVQQLDLNADEDSTSWSIVIHTPEFVKPYIPEGMELSLHHFKAENFQGGRPGRVNIYNEELGPLTGTTRESGFTLSAMDGKLVARVNGFETRIGKRRVDVGGLQASERILLNLARQLDNPANIAQGFTAPDAQAVLPPQGVLDVNGFEPDWDNAEATTDRNIKDDGTQDLTARGMEVEIHFNPTPRWTLLATVARQETVTDNTYPALRRYVDEFVIPTWVDSAFAQRYFIDENATQTLAEFAQRTLVDPVLQANTQDGIPSIEQREWRWSLHTRYNFGRQNDLIPGWLGDFTIGGGIRWEDEIGIGFAVGVNEFGNLDFDTSKPFHGPSQTFVDVFARAEYTLTDKLSLTLQLNVKDLTDHDGLVPFLANPDGSKLYRFLEGRLVTASATLLF